MKQLKLFVVMMAMLMLGACGDDSGDDGEVTGDPVSPVLNEPTDGTSFTVDESNLATELTVSWAAADFGVQVAIAYAVQMDVDGGTFENPVVLAGELTGTSANISYETINDAMISDLELEANAEAGVDIRVVATSSGFDDLVSGISGLTVTTYEEDIVVEPTFANIWVAGSFQGWDATNFISLTSHPDNGVYEGYLYLPEGQLDFKLYQNENDWGPDSWGTDNDGSGTIYVANEACCNFVAEVSGMHWVEVDIPNLTYKLIPIGWGVIGDATPTGWDSDTDLVYNSETQALEVTLDLTSGGSFKFRANDEWVHAFGIDGEGNLVYSDHITNGFTDGTNNLTVAEDGNYTISLDLHNSDEYIYSIVKN